MPCRFLNFEKSEKPMRLVRYETIPAAELLARLKTTRLRGFGQPQVYETATLTLEPPVETSTLAPAQRYVLRQDLETILSLRRLFADAGVDLFTLTGGLLFWLERDGQEEGPIPLTPPIIEESVEADGRTIRLINDGMHRVTAARRCGSPISIILARNVPREYPYYALPLPGGWDEVTELPEIPDGYVKKAYRDPGNYKALFRDFNAVFDGIQKQRKPTALSGA